MQSRYKAAIIGLGKIGSRYNDDPGRTQIWTHRGAYTELGDRFELVGACDPMAENREAFTSHRPDVPVFATTAEMLEALDVDVVSICTPLETHHDVIQEVMARSTPKVIWCEKPLSNTLEEGDRIVDLCARRGVELVVSYVRRWLPIWRSCRDLMLQGEIGTIRSVRISFPCRLLSVGSHGLNLMQYLGGDVVEMKSLEVPALAQDGEPAHTAVAIFRSGATGLFQVTGRKEQLVVEADVLGDDGRIFVREVDSTIRIEKFTDSTKYGGYRELASSKAMVEHAADFASMSPLVAIAQDIADHLDGKDITPVCSGADALQTQKLLDGILQNSQTPGFPIG